MSANIYWIPTRKGGEIETSCPSRFIKTIEETFGVFPVKLDESRLILLQAMFTASGDRCYEQLVELIEKYGEILIEARY